MDRRRLGGVAILAVAVLVLSVGAAVGRPDVVGVAGAPPIDPPPQVGDCLYAGPSDWSSIRTLSDDGSQSEYGFSVRFAPCRGPWNAEVVAVLGGDEVMSGPALHGGPVDPCAVDADRFLGRPDFADPDGFWIPDALNAIPFQPDRRQYAAGQRWAACAVFPPAWNADGTAAWTDVRSELVSTDRSLRLRWNDSGFRDRMASCGSGPSVFNDDQTYCGAAHDREYLAFAFWDRATGAGSLRAGCQQQAARMLQRADPTVGGALTAEVIARSTLGGSELTPVETDTVVPDQGFGVCLVRSTDPDQQLRRTVVGLGDQAPPLEPRR